MLKKRLFMTLVIVATTLGVPVAASALPAEYPQVTENVGLTWTPEYMSKKHLYTAEQVSRMGARNDIVATYPNSLRNLSAAVREANPDVHLLVYSNAGFANNGVARDLPEEAFAHTTDGQRITSTEFGNYLMQPDNSVWREDVVKECRARMSTVYEGCLMDMLTPAGTLYPTYVTGQAAKPETGVVYTRAEWAQLIADWAGELNVMMPSEVVCGNTVVNPSSYFNPTVSSQPIAKAQGCAQLEDWMRSARWSATRFPSEPMKGDSWLDYVKVQQDFEADGRNFLASTKLWATDNTPALTKKWNLYTMATFLLSANGYSYYAFITEQTQAGAIGDTSPYQMPKDLGAPLEAMHALSNGAYVRSFANGYVAVNPTTTAKTILLSKAYTNMDGVRITRLTLPATSGQILR